MDRKFWTHYGDDVRRVFEGELVSTLTPPPDGVTGVRLKRCSNSGAGAIALAVRWGARYVVLIGYDSQHTGGRTHHHGDHPAPLGNARTVTKWPEQFRRLARELGIGARVVNASRVTRVDAWPRMTLEEALA